MSKFGVKSTEGEVRMKPLPLVTSLSAGFWDGLKEGELRIQACVGCGHRQFPPKAACEECGSITLTWIKSNGRGKIYSFAVIRQVVMNSLAFEAEIPYALATIELEEGVRIVAQVQGIPPEQVKTQMEVQVFFEDIGGVSIAKFKPVS